MRWICQKELRRSFFCGECLITCSWSPAVHFVELWAVATQDAYIYNHAFQGMTHQTFYIYIRKAYFYYVWSILLKLCADLFLLCVKHPAQALCWLIDSCEVLWKMESPSPALVEPMQIGISWQCQISIGDDAKKWIVPAALLHEADDSCSWKHWLQIRASNYGFVKLLTEGGVWVICKTLFQTLHLLLSIQFSFTYLFFASCNSSPACQERNNRLWATALGCRCWLTSETRSKKLL